MLNVIMTAPFGFLYPMTRKPAAGLGRTLFFCFLMSLCIEFLQPLFNRNSDVTDMFTNLIGGRIGYGIFVIFRPVTGRILRCLQKES